MSKTLQSQTRNHVDAIATLCARMTALTGDVMSTESWIREGQDARRLFRVAIKQMEIRAELSGDPLVADRVRLPRKVPRTLPRSVPRPVSTPPISPGTAQNLYRLNALGFKLTSDTGSYRLIRPWGSQAQLYRLDGLTPTTADGSRPFRDLATWD